MNRVLILGASGMLGSSLFRYFTNNEDFESFGTVRNDSKKLLFPLRYQKNLHIFNDILNESLIEEILILLRPDLVINCIGVIKQNSESNNPLISISVNSLFPHVLASLCCNLNTRLIHFSTDCVFSGKKGMYIESDYCDSDDLYGKSKCLGEINYPNTITLRTSIIGHELNSNKSLIDWFLSERDTVKGFANAKFSGLPTNEIARIIKEYILPKSNLFGLYHLSSNPIDKYSLLKIVAEIYKKDIKIKRDESFSIDRSLDSSLFRDKTGYNPDSWEILIKNMFNYFVK